MTQLSIKKIGLDPKVQVFILVLVTLFINAKGITKGEPWWTDESRHAMNGIYFLDLIHNLPVGDIYTYSIEYYARYPALSLGYHPPFFPLVEAVFFAIGGISVTTAKMAGLFFGVIATCFWYCLVVLIYDKKIAFFSTLLLFTSPLIVFWSRAIMLELPALALIILSMYAFYNFIDLDRRKYVYWLAVSVALAFSTKQTTVFLLPLFLTYVLLTKNLRKLLHKDVLLAALLCLVLAAPTIVLTLKFGGGSIKLVTLPIHNHLANSRFSLANFKYYISQLPEVLSWPVLALSIASFYFVFKKRFFRRELLFLLWLVWAYLLITYFSAKETRYMFFWLPPFCLLATLALFKLKTKVKKLSVALSIAIVLGVFQTVQAFTLESPFLSGYAAAAKYVAEHPKGYTILVNAFHEGNFVFYFRKYDSMRRNIVLRGSKLLMKPFKNGADRKDLLQILRDYGVKYVICESIGREELPQLELIRHLVRGSMFTKVKEIRLDTNIARYRNRSVLIYEIEGTAKLTKQTLPLLLWRAGMQISFPIDKLLKEQ